MTVLVSTEGLARPAIRAAEVRARAERMLAAMRLADCELSILLCDDETIHGLNREYRKMDKPTDVLAFAMMEGEGGGHAPGVLGDVVISLDTASRQAREHARTLDDEVTMLLAHGLLHLLGLDHRNRREERRMTARTDLLRAAARAREVSLRPGTERSRDRSRTP